MSSLYAQLNVLSKIQQNPAALISNFSPQCYSHQKEKVVMSRNILTH